MREPHATDSEWRGEWGSTIVTDDAARAREPNSRAKSLFADYAAGTLSEPFAVLVAAHRQMRGDDRFGAVPTERPISPSSAIESRDDKSWEHISAIMPLALRAYVSRQQATPGTLEWKAFLPGIERCWLSRSAGGDAYLLRCRGGSAIPQHSHGGREGVLVLQGSFHDTLGRYSVGDLAVADHTIAHRPVADREGICIIFVVLEAPVRLTGLIGRAIQRILGF